MSKYTDITIMLDRSGSMEEIREQTIRGFNSFIDEQKRIEGKATITLVQFDDLYEQVYEARDIKEISALNYKAFVPRGTTALLDAIGRTIINTDKRVIDFKPEDVVFVIITDGLENASVEYSRKKIFEMIKKRQNWQFVFMGTNQDAIKEAGYLGIAKDASLTFQNDEDGIQDAFMSMSENLSGVREKKLRMHFSKEQRRKQDR